MLFQLEPALIISVTRLCEIFVYSVLEHVDATCMHNIIRSSIHCIDVPLRDWIISNIYSNFASLKLRPLVILFFVISKHNSNQYNHTHLIFETFIFDCVASVLYIQLKSCHLCNVSFFFCYITVLDNCLPNPCENGGTCNNGGGDNGYSCLCMEGFTGPICGIGQSCNIV